MERFENFAAEWLPNLAEGRVRIGATDRNGNALHQFDEVVYDHEILSIFWSLSKKEYVAQSEKGHRISFEYLHLTEKRERQGITA